jgi:superfamily II DNA/RNA helicase
MFIHRNCTNYTTVWGNRHLRQGFIDKETEKEELQLFEDQKKLAEQKSEGIENYDDLKVEIINKFNKDLPKFEEKFENLNLNEHLAENIKRCGYERLTIIQRHAIPLITSQINVMAASQTGSGKTASFLLPIIQNLIEKGPPNPDIKEDVYRKCISRNIL